MKKLILLILLIPTLCFALPGEERSKDNMNMDCEAIEGATCRQACLPDEMKATHAEIMEGNIKGKQPELFCGIITLKQGDDLLKKGIKLMKSGKEASRKDIRMGICCMKKSAQ